MKSVLAILASSLLAACANLPPDSTPCTEPRPQVCTLQFEPTCAVMGGGERREFSSPCVACADPAVTGYTSGPCPE